MLEYNSRHSLHQLPNMASKQDNIFFFFFFFFLHCLCFTSQSFNNETDYLSLLSFKNKITDDPLNSTRSWNDSVSFCHWLGVTCSSRRHRVTMLSLPSLKLGGSLSPSIANLTFLRLIDLRGNNFGGQIPPEIGRLFRLQHILLSENRFSGEIPANLSRCLDLRVINFNHNSLTGTIPTQLAGLSNLIALHISANQLTGGIPPVLGNMSSLVNLSIAINTLGGSIPYNLGRLYNLQLLQVGSNNLSGTIPPPVFNLSRISIFAVTFNNLVGSFPEIHFVNLKQFLVGVNMFSGNIPLSLSNISGLQFIDLPDNRFSGRVPSDFGRITNLQKLNVGRNFLEDSGAFTFIESLTNCSKLEMLGIDNNLFSGLFPHTIANLSINMNSILLGGNQFSGKLPSGLTNLINLNTLHASFNNFDGPILADIGKLSNLRQLYMNQNRFPGKIPDSIGNLTELFELRLDGNKLESNIPSSVGNCKKLQVLNLSDNSLSGIVPVQVFALTSLTVTLNLARNSLNGTLPVDVGSFLNLRELDLSDNEFSGGVPDGLSRCLSLEHIYLQRNSLTGTIPLSLSALKGIQNLDLSRNGFTGNIPSFLQDFVFLMYLNLSFNRFEGEVPENGVFGNRSGVYLEGNSQLCGGKIELGLPVCNSGGKRGNSYLIGAVCGVLGFALVSYIVVSCILKRLKKGSTTFPSSDWNSNFSYNELEKATNAFSSDSLIGTGSFASVYKGNLSENGKAIAVKVLRIQEKGISKMYVAECEALSNIRHRNLVKVFGCCSGLDSEGRDFKAIVLDLMPNGPLDKWLHCNEGNNSLDIVQRLNIAIDVASALEYLHHYCRIAVVHCDLKPGNVLLDSDFCAHVSDFGLAKFIRKQAESQSSSIGIRGSVGYVAPEYGMGGPASISGDVYSFGILVLEMITGRRPTDELFKDGLSLHKYAKNGLSSDNVFGIVDPSLVYGMQQDLKRFLELIVGIGIACSEGVPQERMNIKDANLKLQLIRGRCTESLVSL